MGFIKKWRKENQINERTEFVFDRLSKGRCEIDSYFAALVSGGQLATTEVGVYEGCWSFQDRAQVVQLQAADIWAYEFFRFMRDSDTPDGGLKKEPRKSLLSLALAPTNFTEFHDRVTLADFVQKIAEAGIAI